MIFLETLGLLGAIMGFVIGIFILTIAIYVYFALALMAIAKRTNTKNGWMAWIPYANVYLISKIAQKHWWPILLLVPSIIFAFFPENIILSIIELIFLLAFLIFIFIWWWKICKIRGKPGWWILLALIPFIGQIWVIILLGILAWGKDRNVPPSKVPAQNIPNVAPAPPAQ